MEGVNQTQSRKTRFIVFLFRNKLATLLAKTLQATTQIVFTHRNNNAHGNTSVPSDLTLFYLLDSDDDEDITVHRKPHRNAIRDSESEEEEAAADNSVCMAEALVLPASSGEEAEADEGDARGPQRSRRISQAPVDSDASGPELEKREDAEEQLEGRRVRSSKEQKKREKSQRHREKKEKRSKAVEKVKKRDRFSDIRRVGETRFCFGFFVLVE